jgi:hypothetical protein
MSEQEFTITTSKIQNKHLKRFVEFIISKLKQHHILEPRVEYIEKDNVERVTIDLHNLEKSLFEQFEYFESLQIRIGAVMVGREELNTICSVANLKHVCLVHVGVSSSLYGYDLVLNPFIYGIGGNYEGRVS